MISFLKSSSSGKSKINIFVQNEEPETFDGIWIKSNTFKYDNIIETDSTTQANSINFIKGTGCNTILYPGIENGLKYYFKTVFITDNNNNIDYETEVYFGNGTRWVLAEEYIQLEYIEFTGVQALDTGIKEDDSNMKYKVRYMSTDTSQNGRFLFSAYNSSNNYGLGGIYVTQYRNIYYVYYGSTQTKELSTVFYKNHWLVLTTTHSPTQVDIALRDEYYGRNYSESAVISSSYGNGNICIGCQSKTYNYKFIGKISSFQIYKNDVLCCNFVPARRGRDNVIGMYDTLNKRFLENVGTGTFTGGSEV